MERAICFSFKGVLLAIFFSRKSQLKKVDILFICHDNSRTALVDSLKYSPITDTIIDDLEPSIKSLTLCSPFSKYYGKSCYGNVVMYNGILLRSYLIRLLFKRSLNLKNVEDDPVVRSWNKTLELLQPKIIIGVNPSPELCIAAKKVQIIVADIQHGVLAPGNYYDLKKRASIQQNGWPDIILCWDQFSKNFVDTRLKPHVRSLIIGHPAIFSSAKSKLFNPNNSKETCFGSSISVLVTLTSICPDNYKGDKLFEEIGIPSSLVNFIQKSGSFVTWHLRLHPAQMNNWKEIIYKKLSSIFNGFDNVIWTSSSEATLHGALDRCSVHVTFNSASAREAAILGIETGILDPDEQTAILYFGDMIEKGKISMVSAENHEEFKKWIINANNKYIERDSTINKMSIPEGKIQYTTFIEKLQRTVSSNRNVLY